MSLAEALLPPSQTRRAVLILLAALATLAAVWIFQGLGYEPCELCLTERYAFYAGAPLAALTALFASRSMHGLARAGFALIALVFLANVAFAFYHVGVEQHWWPGPTACTGALSAPVDVKDLMKALETTQRRQVRRGAAAHSRPVARRLGCRRQRRTGDLRRARR